MQPDHHDDVDVLDVEPAQPARRPARRFALLIALVALVISGLFFTSSPTTRRSDCSWVTAAQQQWAALVGVDGPEAEQQRAELRARGVDDPTGPPGCPAPAPHPRKPEEVPGPPVDGLPLHGPAQLGFFDAAQTGTGRVIPVSGGDIGAVAAGPGDVVEIAAGTYPGFRPRSGAPGAWITYRAAPGAEVIVTGGGAREDGLIELGSGTSWVHLEGLTVRNSPGYGIFANGASHVALTDIEIDGTQDGGIVVLDSDNVRVEGCNVHGTNARGLSANHEAISMAGGTDTFEVFNCQVHGNGEEGIDTKDEARNGVVHHNLVWGNRGPNVYVDSTGGPITIEHNYVWGAREASKPGILLGVESYSARQLLANVTVRNNTVWGNAGGGIEAWKEGAGTIRDVVVENNTTVAGNPVVPFGGVTVRGNHGGPIPEMPEGFVG